MASIFRHILSSNSPNSSSSTSKSSITTTKKSKILNLRRKSEVVNTASSKLIVSVLKQTEEENNKVSSTNKNDLNLSPSARNRRHSVPEPTIHIEEASSLDTIHEVIKNITDICIAFKARIKSIGYTTYLLVNIELCK